MRSLPYFGARISTVPPPQNLGGVLTSGPAALSIAPGGEFAGTWVFVRGIDQRVWYRNSPAGNGTWTGWTRLGGIGPNGGPPPLTIGAPGVVSNSVVPTVLVRGTDNALWLIALNGGRWASRGGRLASSPVGLRDSLTGALDIFALGADHAVWEFNGGWHRVGGTSTVAPAVVQLPSGETDLFARGPHSALWMNVRAPGATAWRGRQRQGGILTSAPAAGVFPRAPLARSVLVLSRDGALWRGLNEVAPYITWGWAQVP